MSQPNRVGTCSLCGGDVVGHRGPWWGVVPPPPDRCVKCGAVSASDVIPMFPAPRYPKNTNGPSRCDVSTQERKVRL